ncbi:MAG: hypothetical protein R2939_15065 [Kofleriaceae bacterium]
MQRARRWIVASVALALGAGCPSDRSVRCADGSVCASGTQCAGPGRCALAEQVAACVGLGDGDGCEVASSAGVCVDGVCVARGCGNGVLDPGEVCYDGNTAFVDGCSGLCSSDETCGNGRTDDVGGEACDCGDGSVPLPTGCPGPNSDEPGALCRSDCSFATCGDGIVAAPEDCEADDLGAGTCAALGFYQGELACAANCRYDAAGCSGFCGDGVRNGPEPCDGEVATSCAAYGFDHGRPACGAGCDVDVSACGRFGFARTPAGGPDAYRMWVAASGALFTMSGEWLARTQDGLTTSARVYELNGGLVGSQVVSLQDLHGCADDDVFAVASAEAPAVPAEVWHWDGSSWTAVEVTQGGSTLVRCVAPGVAVVASSTTAALGLLEGATFTPLAAPPGVGAFNALDGTLDDLLAATDAGLWRFDGASWVEEIASVELRAMAREGQEVWAGAADGTVHHFDGTTWSTSVGPTGPRRMIRVAGRLAVLPSTLAAIHVHDGRGWLTWVPFSTTADIVAGVAPLPPLLATSGGAVYGASGAWLYPEYTLGGAVALLASDGALWTSSAGLRRDGIAVPAWNLTATRIWEGPDGTVRAIAGNGQAYQGAACPPGAQRTIVDAYAATATETYGLSQSNLSGQVPGLRLNGTPVLLGGSAVQGWAIDGVAADEIYVVGEGGRIFRFDGAAWAPMPGPAMTTLTAVRALGAGQLVVGDDAGGIWRWTDADGAWTELSAAALGAGRVHRLDHSARGLLALTANRGLLVRDDLGWTEVTGTDGATKLTARGDEIVIAAPLRSWLDLTR